MRDNVTFNHIVLEAVCEVSHRVAAVARVRRIRIVHEVRRRKGAEEVAANTERPAVWSVNPRRVVAHAGLIRNSGTDHHPIVVKGPRAAVNVCKGAIRWGPSNIQIKLKQEQPSVAGAANVARRPHVTAAVRSRRITRNGDAAAFVKSDGTDDEGDRVNRKVGHRSDVIVPHAHLRAGKEDNRHRIGDGHGRDKVNCNPCH